MNVVLVGMPGSGKSAVAKELGGILNRSVIDTDEIIVTNHGEINDIFKNFGEEVFRSIERKVVEAVCKMDNVVISTGGGCLLRERNRELLKGSGKIIFLQASPDTLYNRTVNDDTRPLLAGEKKQKIEKLLNERTPIYLGAADFTIDTDNLNPREIAQKITEFMK